MIAARIARQDAEPAPRRDFIGKLLFWKLEECEQRPGLMFSALGVLIMLAGVLEKVWS